MNHQDALPQQSDGRDRIKTSLQGVAKAMAIFGGLMFIALVGMSLVSIIGRKLGFGPINGDIEMMQAGTAIAAVAFMPYCTLIGENIKVDFFTEFLNASLKRTIDGMAEVLFAMVLAVLTWRTGLSAISLHEAGEVTTLVSIPVWMTVAALVPALALTTLCALFRAAVYFRPATHLPGSAS